VSALIVTMEFLTLNTTAVLRHRTRACRSIFTLTIPRQVVKRVQGGAQRAWVLPRQTSIVWRGVTHARL